MNKIVTILLVSFCALTSVSAQTATTATADTTKKKGAATPEVITPEQLQDSLDTLQRKKKEIEDKTGDYNNASEYLETYSKEKKDSIFVANYQRAQNTNNDYIAAKKLFDEVLAGYSATQATRQSMNIYAEVKREKTYQGYLQLVSGKLSNLGNENIARLRGSIENYKDKSGYKKMVEDACRNREIYDRCINALNAPFCKDTILSVRRKEIPMLNNYNNKSPQNTLSDEQFKELDSLDISLSRYEGGVRELGKLIDKVNADVNVKKLLEANDTTGYIERVKSIIGENDANKNLYERYFNRLPYLKKLIDDYLVEVQQDPTSRPIKTEYEIKKLCNALS